MAFGLLVNPLGIRMTPNHYSLRFTGPEDNGGVHTNSTIPLTRSISPSRAAGIASPV